MKGPEAAVRLALALAAALGLWVGWSVFWFQCDDAYIAFRYVSNSRLGLGYTWNPPPFRPVEGYTSFLWVVLLDLVWRVLRIAPPIAANALSLLFSAASLSLVFAMVLRLRVSSELARSRTLLLALVLFGTLTNRTFLAWTSSGLETALFGFLLLAWTYLGVFAPATRRALAGLGLTAGLLALTRPDGLLFAAATAAILGLRATASAAPRGRVLVAGLPLLLPVAHVAWRRLTYGYWLPNTYYAKHLAAWPEAGARYLAAFALEYAYWVWLALAGVAGVHLLRSGDLPARVRANDLTALARSLVPTTLFLHFAYYTFRVGGDHFEFRVYQHLVPLLLVSFAVVAERAGLSARRSLAALAMMIALGLPIPWLNWWHSQRFVVRSEAFTLRLPVAPHLPAPFRWYGAAWDNLEAWLIERFVGVRHQEHKVFAEHLAARFPTRATGSRLRGTDVPVMAFNTVGVVGWVLPHVAILDTYGLNDAVIAHSPLRGVSEERYMGHSLGPPDGYVECFRPNIVLRQNGTVEVQPRAAPLTDDEIRRCEAKFLAGGAE